MRKLILAGLAAGCEPLPTVHFNEPPGPPTISLSPLDPQTVDDLEVVIEIEADDPEGDAITYGYSWYLDGVFYSDTLGDTLPSARTVKGQAWTVEVVASDGEWTSNAAVAGVQILNIEPVMVRLSLTPTDPATGDDLVIEAEGSDGDSDALSYLVTWLLDGVEQPEFADQLVLDAAETALLDGWTARVSAFDGVATSEPIEASVLVGNTAPTLRAITLSPSSPRVGDAITATAGGVEDVDGQDVMTTFEWYVDEALVLVSSETARTTQLSGLFSKGDSVYVVATPSDGWIAGEALTSASVTVANTPPELTSVEIMPPEPTTLTDLSCHPGTATDADGDGVDFSYSWQVNGSSAGVPSAALSSDHFNKGDVVVCEVVPDDGDEAGAAVRADAVTVVNSLPTIIDLVLSPSEAYVDDRITASVTTEDLDGDSVGLRYDWRIDGVSTGVTSSSLSCDAYCAKGDEVTVVVTPNDGSADGRSETSAPLSILNSPPEAPVVVISGESEDDDLFCEVGEDPVDADGDRVTATFTWTVDGEDFADAVDTTWTGDTVEASQTNEDELWECSVVLDDGEDESAPGGASVELLGNYGYGLSFDGSNDYVQVDDLPALEPPFTVELWVRPDRVSREGVIIGRYHAGTRSDSEFMLRMQSDGRVRLASTGSTSIDSSMAIDDGEWHHVAGVVNGSSSVLYVDGSRAGGGTLDAPETSTQPVVLGTYGEYDSGFSASWFSGDVDEIRISSAARYSARFDPAGGWSTDSSTVVLWHCDTGTGSTMVDETTVADGTLDGPEWIEVTR